MSSEALGDSLYRVMIAEIHLGMVPRVEGTHLNHGGGEVELRLIRGIEPAGGHREGLVDRIAARVGADGVALWGGTVARVEVDGVKQLDVASPCPTRNNAGRNRVNTYSHARIGGMRCHGDECLKAHESTQAYMNTTGCLPASSDEWWR